MGRIITAIGVFAAVIGFAGWYFGLGSVFGLFFVIGFGVAVVSWAFTGRENFTVSPDTKRANDEEAKEPPMLPGNWNGPT